MKRRSDGVGEVQEDVLDTLASVIDRLRGPTEARAFLEDLCTPAELESMTDRWRVVPLLAQGIPYREIHERTHVSVTTIGRVARTLGPGAGGYGQAPKPRRAAPAKYGTPPTSDQEYRDDPCAPRARSPPRRDPEIRPAGRPRPRLTRFLRVELAREPRPPVLLRR